MKICKTKGVHGLCLSVFFLLSQAQIHEMSKIATLRNELVLLASLTLKLYLISPLVVLKSMLSRSFT